MDKKESLTQEDQLLLWCARKELLPEIEEKIRKLIERKLQWDYLVRQALKHEVFPLLYRNLKRIQSDTVPQEVLEQLKFYYRQNAVYNILMKNELLAILQLFYTNGIPAIPIKGPVLTESVYGDLSLRVFSDLDLLVQKQDMPRIKICLLSLNYQPEFLLNSWQEKWLLKYDEEYNFDRVLPNNLSVHLEIHWNIVSSGYPFRIHPKDLWEDTRRIKIDGTEAYSLSPENHLLLLCIHTGKHGWTPLKWICDLSELITSCKDRINWAWVIEKTNTWRIRKIMLTSLVLTQELLGTDIPDDILKEFGGGCLRKPIPKHVRRQIFPHDPPISSPVLKAFSWLRFIEGNRDKVAYVFHLLLKPTKGDFTLVRLSPSLAFLYWIIRPFRLFSRYGLRPCSAVIGIFWHKRRAK